MAGAKKIFAVDINPAKYACDLSMAALKFEIAKKFGATDCINPKDYPDKPIQQVITGLSGNNSFIPLLYMLAEIRGQRAASASTTPSRPLAASRPCDQPWNALTAGDWS
eukprot:766568-Hanusia_phi.AAC.6